jgi:uncharacterized protein (TIGR02453 family)
MAQNPLNSELFGFLRELAENNNREWFQANKARYKREVQEPLLQFIAAFGEPLGEFAPQYLADPRPVGGSMFRIHRDVRFSKDKRPYKTQAAAQFRHRQGKDVHAPGFYLHLEPGSVFGGAGIWHPDGQTLKLIRQAIVDDPGGWTNATKALQLGGDSLKRAPKGFDPDHPLIDELRRKDFVCMFELTEGEVLDPAFVDRFAESCRTTVPMMRFLTGAVGLPY